jgi:tetratricopeptide (TPR) repeat protein
MHDPAELAFLPLIRLEDGPAANLTARAATHWMGQGRHDAWGAFMLLVEPSRRLLRAGGLVDIALVADELSVPGWQAQLARRTGEDAIWLARLLLYMNFVADAETVLERRGPCEDGVELWAIHLAALCARMRHARSRSPALEHATAAGRPACTRLAFHAALSCAWVHFHERPDRTRARQWIAHARRAIDPAVAEPWQLPLAGARVAYYEAIDLDRCGEAVERDRVLDTALDALRAPPADAGAAYLHAETARRLLDLRYRIAIAARDDVRAAAIAAEIVTLDPTCGRARWLAADVARRTGRTGDAIRELRAAACYGPIERPAALAALAALVPDPAHADELAVQAASARAAIGAPLDTPATASYQFQAGGTAQTAIAAPQPQHRVYGQMRPFWELRAPDGPAPMLSQTPLLAWDAFRAGAEPWYRTLLCQRLMVASFRRELAYASTPALAWSERPVVTDLAGLAGRSPEVDALLATCDRSAALPPVRRALLSRTVAALGFQRESLAILPAPLTADRLGPDAGFVEYTRLFTHSLIELGSPAWSDDGFEALYHRIAACDDTLRLRLLLAINGCVRTAQHRRIARAAAWRERATEMLRAVQRCPAFSAFEHELLESRYWRAVCYVPFLTGDHAALRAEAEACERLARGLVPRSAHEALIGRENRFPMLETTARIYTALGDHDRAHAGYEEISREVDPQDAKAWLQVGESRERRGDAAGARSAFLRAQALGAPLGHVAAYQAGRLSEQLGLVEEAILCQLRSLALWPAGLSPLHRLHALGHRAGDPSLVEFAARGLARVRDRGSAAPAERARIEQRIGAAA